MRSRLPQVRRSSSSLALLALTVVLGAGSSLAQHFEQGGRIGGLGQDFARSLALDAEGNSYLVWEFEGTVDADPGPEVVTLTPSKADAIALTKFDAEGEFVWVKVWEADNIFLGDVAIAPDSAIYISGRFQDVVDFDPGPGTVELDGGMVGTNFLLKLDPDGDFLRVDDEGFQLHGLAVDAAGDVYSAIAGVVQKRDPDGNEIWRRHFDGGTLANGGSGRPLLVLDPMGNPHVTGVFQGTPDFDPGIEVDARSSNGSGDVFIVKLTGDGDLAWARTLGGTLEDRHGAIAISPNGDVTVSGLFRGTVDLDPGPGTSEVTAENVDIFLLRLDSAGETRWVHAFGGEGDNRAFGVASDGAGNSYMTGYVGPTLDFDPGPDETVLMSASAVEAFTAKYDADGNLVWVAEFEGLAFESGHAVAVQPDGGVVTTGRFTHTIDLDPGPAVESRIAAGLNDIWIVLLGQDDADLDGFLSPEDCNDNAPDISPAAMESCDNGIDDDCNGQIDLDDDACRPLLVRLESFDGVATRRGILLRWSTALEIDNFGFRVWRERVDGTKKRFEQVGEGWIPGQGSSLVGAEYSLLDHTKHRPGSIVRYYLEDLDSFGRLQRHGPITVHVGRSIADRSR